MKKSNIALLVLIASGAFVLIYSIGYQIGRREDERRHLILNLDMNVDLYQKAEHGDLVGVKSQLGFFILGQFNSYAQHFGDERFLHYDDARQIATVAATNGDAIGFKR